MHNHEPPGYACPFCRMQQANLAEQDDVVFENHQLFACLGLHHHEGSGPTVLVVPKQHVEHLYDISPTLLANITTTAQWIAIQMRQLWGLQGTTLWQHNEPSGSQDVWHFHLHVKGRYQHDGLYQGASNILTSAEQRIEWANALRRQLASTPQEHSVSPLSESACSQVVRR